eukprot:1156574-Pelagomonas_calceolata.AAC.3
MPTILSGHTGCALLLMLHKAADRTGAPAHQHIKPDTHPLFSAHNSLHFINSGHPASMVILRLRTSCPATPICAAALVPL